MKPTAFLALLSLSFLPLPAALGADPGISSRPFWTERASYVEGVDLFVVGIATGARTQEEGRQAAFEHGKKEFLNYAQIRHLEMGVVQIDTQMTFEEKNADGSYNVFRLMKVPVDALTAQSVAAQKVEPEPTPAKDPETKRKVKVSVLGAVYGGLIGAILTLGNPGGIAFGAVIGGGWMAFMAN